MPAPKKRSRKKKTEPSSRGLTAGQVAGGSPPAAVEALRRAIEEDGGSVAGAYRDPVGGNWQIFAALPVAKVVPTPFQRDLSKTHVDKLAAVIDKLDRFVDPIVAVRTEEGLYWTPNGHHRTAAVKQLGGRSIVALVLPDAEVAYKILALNTEKAHNLREKSIEVIRMARSLALLDPRPEEAFALEFEEPSYLTLGLCYEKNGRFAGGAYNPVLRRVDTFLSDPLPKALVKREERAAKVMELEEAVAAAMKALKARGFESPYLRAFVVARVNPLRFQKGAAEFDATLDKMIASARRFNPASVKPDQIARASGPPDETT
jgi:ParB family chromosome partitioning protein